MLSSNDLYLAIGNRERSGELLLYILTIIIYTAMKLENTMVYFLHGEAFLRCRYCRMPLVLCYVIG